MEYTVIYEKERDRWYIYGVTFGYDEKIRGFTDNPSDPRYLLLAVGGTRCWARSGHIEYEPSRVIFFKILSAEERGNEIVFRVEELAEFRNIVVQRKRRWEDDAGGVYKPAHR